MTIYLQDIEKAYQELSRASVEHRDPDFGDLPEDAIAYVQKNPVKSYPTVSGQQLPPQVVVRVESVSPDEKKLVPVPKEELL